MEKYAYKTWGHATGYAEAREAWHIENVKGCALLFLTKKTEDCDSACGLKFPGIEGCGFYDSGGLPVFASIVASHCKRSWAYCLGSDGSSENLPSSVLSRRRRD
ncbi:hypothetical protein CRG98_002297 [Punica granatum]|uniref:Uncharacterized protein n=1 Tax=Punica granatum TaxID=22663 RepID=A0A2I0L9I3_PUNGR|nr:hypothetical protein CRG98_002297 [Punica granatum]